MTAFVALVGLAYAGIQLRAANTQIQNAGEQLKNAGAQLEASYKINSADHDWNRRMAAQAALKEYNQSVLTSALQAEFNYLNCSESIPLKDIQKGFEGNPALQNELHQILNFYEGLARGVFQQIYDEEVIKTGRRGAIIKALRAFSSYIEDRRSTLSPFAWSDLDALVAKWVLEEKGKNSRVATNAQP